MAYASGRSGRPFRSRRRSRRRPRTVSSLRRFLGQWLLIALLGLQGFLVAGLYVDGSSPPPVGGFLEVLWVHNRPWLAYGLIALVIAGPVLSIGLWMCRGTARWAMMASWALVAAVSISFFSGHVDSVTRVVWKREISPRLAP